MNFKCLSTISLNNIPVLKAHLKNSMVRVNKELKNNYLLIEFVPAPDTTGEEKRKLKHYLPD